MCMGQGSSTVDIAVEWAAPSLLCRVPGQAGWQGEVCSGHRPCPLVLSQSWADAFRSSPDLTGVVAVYEDLRRKGLEFPMTDLDMLSPIHTPQRVRSCPTGGCSCFLGPTLAPTSP